MLGETIALCRSDDVAKRLEVFERYVCYTDQEMKMLSDLAKSMKPEDWQTYGKKIHAVKKTFPGSRVQEIIKKDPPPSEPDSKPDSESSEPDESHQLPIPGLRFPNLG